MGGFWLLAQQFPPADLGGGGVPALVVDDGFGFGCCSGCFWLPQQLPAGLVVLVLCFGDDGALGGDVVELEEAPVWATAVVVVFLVGEDDGFSACLAVTSSGV